MKSRVKGSLIWSTFLPPVRHGSSVGKLVPDPSTLPPCRFSFFVMFACLVVLAQQVAAKIVLQIPPHRVDVIRVVLRVVILDERGRALDAIIMRFAALQAPGPGEVNLVDPRVSDLLQLPVRDVALHVLDVFGHQLP